MECPHKNECVNHNVRCHACYSMSDMMNPYPKFVDQKEHERRLKHLMNSVPELVSAAGRSPYDKERLVRYLVMSGVRVEVD